MLARGCSSPYCYLLCQRHKGGRPWRSGGGGVAACRVGETGVKPAGVGAGLLFSLLLPALPAAQGWQGPRRTHRCLLPACKSVCSRASLLARWPVGFTQSLSVIVDAVFYSVYDGAVARACCGCFRGPKRAPREGSAVGITDEVSDVLDVVVGLHLLVTLTRYSSVTGYIRYIF